MRCHVNKRELFNKFVAWSLITTMVNPAMIAPAFARDSDIYLSTTTGTSTAEPNVLFILGTNDRMNVAEAWREYDPVTYDSHAEYLWNDINIISVQFTEDVTINAAQLSLTPSPDIMPPPAGFDAATYSYSSGTLTATWVFHSNLPLDKYLINIPSAAVTNVNGAALDGEFTTTSTIFPSGNGTAGGDFNFWIARFFAVERCPANTCDKW